MKIINRNQLYYLLAAIVVALSSYIFNTNLTNSLILFTGLVLLEDK